MRTFFETQCMKVIKLDKRKRHSDNVQKRNGWEFHTIKVMFRNRIQPQLLTCVLRVNVVSGDPCAIDNGGCCSNAECIPKPHGDRTCKCKPGFIGDGHVCTREYNTGGIYLFI